MAQPSFLIVGLGNPGSDYAKTRHNIGFMAVDRLAEAVRATSWQKKYKAEIASATIDGIPCILIKPQTYMNLSGESVGEALRFYKLKPENVIVIHDDLDLLPAQVKVKQGGGAGGHNGLKSLDAHISPAYWRVRLGIGHPEDRAQVTGYVLGAFSKSDQTWISPLLDGLTQHFALLFDAKVSLFVQKMQS